MNKLIFLVPALLLFFSGYGQAPKKKPSTKITLPAIAAIRPSELQADLFELSDDHFRGREAGTLDELKASVWLAEKARQAGLTPAGEDGTFFQFFSLQRNRIAANSTVSVNHSLFTLWKDVLITQTAAAEINAPLIFINASDPSGIDSTSIKGKAVVMVASPRGLDLDISLPERRYPGFLLRKFSSTLINNGAAAIIFIADTMGEKSWQAVLPAVMRGLYDIEGGPSATTTPRPPVLWFHSSAEPLLKKEGAVLKTNIIVEKYEYQYVRSE